MLTHSIFYRALLKLWAFLSTYQEGFFAQCFQKGEAAVGKTFRNSFLYSFLTGRNLLAVSAKHSVILDFFDALLIGVIGFCTKIYKNIRRMNRDGVNQKFFDRFHKTGLFSFETIAGVLIALMFIVPGNQWNNAYGLLLAVGLAGLYFLVLLSGRRFSYHLKGLPFLLMVFLFSCFLSVVISYAPRDSFRVLLFFVTAFLLMLVLAGSLRNRSSFQRFLGVLYAGVWLTALYCVLQGIQGVDVDVRLTDVTANAGMPGRAFSTFENPNNYAEFLVLFFPFLMAFSLNLKRKSVKIFTFALLVVPFAALLYTYSRSCWVSFALSMVVFLALYNYRYLPLLLLAGIALVPFLPQTVLNRILTIGSMTDTSNQYRLLIWDGVLKMLKDTWVSGIGLGPVAFSRIYPSFAHSNAVLAPHSHMLYLQILVETGILGFVSFGLYWLATLKRSISQLLKPALSSEKRTLLIAGVSSLTGILFVSGAEYIWFYPRVLFSFFIVLGLVTAALSLPEKEGS